MAKLFIGISLALMLATAVVGFMAKGKIDTLKLSWSETKQNLSREQASLQLAKNDIKQKTEELGLANSKITETTQSLEAKTMELSTRSQQLADAQEELKTQLAEVERVKRLLATTTPGVAAPGGPDPQIAELNEKLQKAQVEVAEKETLLQAALNRGKDNEVKLSEMTAMEKKRRVPITLAGLQGRVLAVNAGWNFVVLNVGDQQGVSVNAQLLVVRGNAPVARLRITSVEPSTSIADVVPSSLNRGMTVQPGDTVIFEGKAATTELIKPSADSTAGVGVNRG